MPKRRKAGMGFKLAMAALLGVLVVAVGLFLMDRIKKSKGSQRHDIMLADAAKPETTEILMSGLEFARFLNEAANADTDEKQKATFQVLMKAKPNDGTDFDAATADFLTKTVEILPEVREAMIREILTKRVNAAMVPALTEFARETKHTPTAIAIFKAISPVVGDNQFEAFLSVAQYSKNADLRQAAEDCAVAVIRKSKSRPKLLALVDAAVEGSSDPKIRESLRRIKAAGGG